MIRFALLVVGAVTALVLRLVLDREYTWWAPRLATGLLRFASIAVPADGRRARLAEWNAELAVLRCDGESGLGFAMSIAVSAPVLAGAERLHRVGSTARRLSGITRRLLSQYRWTSAYLATTLVLTLAASIDNSYWPVMVMAGIVVGAWTAYLGSRVLEWSSRRRPS